MTGSIAIKVESVTKVYRLYDKPQDRLKEALNPFRKSYHHDFYAVNNISFEVKKGETVGIIGRNGSGKSTLLQLICGVLTPTKGVLDVNGRIAALLELGAGFNPEATGRENVYMNATILGLSTDEIDTRFDSIVEFAEIGEFIEQPIKNYSSGMMVRLAFAVAINVDPEILIVDEALSVGDELFQRKCFSRIEAIKKNGATILFVSHSGGQIVELCDRAILIDSGGKLAVGEPKKIVGLYQKLLYAPEEKQVIIRDKIRNTKWSELENSLETSKNDSTELAATHPEMDTEIKETFDPNLKPTSTIEYESHGAHISSPAILTLQGEQVNHLVSGRSYYYTYTVYFSKEAKNVKMGMLIKTSSGLELGGGVTAVSASDSIAVIKQGATIPVQFQFLCSLNPGLYYMNAGVLGEVKDGETYLHRVSDFVIFRVLARPKNLSTGIIDFNCFPDVI